MKILITGIEGYIGSILGKELQTHGHAVAGIDTGYYGAGVLLSSPQQNVLHEDIRNITESQIRGYDTVIHLADLSNDPLGMIDEKTTREINYYGAVEFAKKSKRAGVKRYIYSSSCSVYGIQTGGLATETSETHPQTMYARCKLDTEKAISRLAGSTFSPVFLRNATVYGLSPRMRFDLVINKLVADAFLYDEISLDNGGKQWRPLIHIKDVCRAFRCAVEAPRKTIHNQIFNVGNRNGNYRVSDLGAMIKDEFPTLVVHVKRAAADTRSYAVSFEKIHESLPGFSCRHTVRAGIHELNRQYKKIGLTEELFTNQNFTRVKQIQHLLKLELLDNHFFWNTDIPVSISL